jgi:hypothetical protein
MQMCLVWCWLIVTQGTPSLALCVANLVVTGNCSEQFRLNLQKHADTTSVSRTTDFESLFWRHNFKRNRSDRLERIVARCDLIEASIRPSWTRYKPVRTLRVEKASLSAALPLCSILEAPGRWAPKRESK